MNKQRKVLITTTYNEMGIIIDTKAEEVAQPGWIPVTERLPEVKQRVLVQQKDGFMMVRKCIDGGHLAWFYSDIVAWMPLPEPWKGEKP